MGDCEILSECLGECVFFSFFLSSFQFVTSGTVPLALSLLLRRLSSARLATAVALRIAPATTTMTSTVLQTFIENEVHSSLVCLL